MLVYDPFMGIGTTAIACMLLRVDYIGTEIDKNYIKIANELIAKKRIELYHKEAHWIQQKPRKE